MSAARRLADNDPLLLLAAVRAIGGHPISSAPRFAYWSPRGEHRIVCANGHTWSPRSQSRRGSSTVRCDYDAGHSPCGVLLCEIVTDQYPKRLVAEVSRADLDYMLEKDMKPESEIAYLMNEKVKT